MAKNIFREYDIRGIYEKELNEQIVKKIGYYFAQEVKDKVADVKYISVGYDARLHSPQLSEWLISGINYAGLEVLTMGLVPTPVNYFSNFTQFDGKTTSASIMITGSHNPPEYNGFKITIDKAPFFGEDIYTLGDKVLESTIDIPDNTISMDIDAKEQYIEYLADEFKYLDLSEYSFVFDCGNGGAVLGDILKKLSINYKIMYEEPDGTFPNHHPDPSEVETLEDIKDELKTDKYTLGFAYDGDADRIAVLSKKYSFKGDILALFFSRFIENPIVIGEVKCSQIMYDTINTYGKAIMYKTGHSNLKVKIKETKASFAAEVSGHIFFNDRYFGYDDAIYSTLRALELVSNGFDYDGEYEKLPKLFSTDEINIDTTEGRKFKIIDELKEKLSNPPQDFPPIKEIITVDGVRVVFENGWGLIRASNTTPKLVTRFESTDEKTALEYQQKLLDLIKLAPLEKFKVVVEYAPLVSIDLIIKKDNKILLGKRVNKPAFGYYFTTGGIVRKNESFKDAMKRIANNELGIHLSQEPKFIGVFEHFYNDSIFDEISTHYVNHGYLLELEEELAHLPKEQHCDYKWFSIGDLLESSEVHHYVKDYFDKK